MPRLARVFTEQDMSRREAGSRMDLTPYLDMIERVRQEGAGGDVELEDGENQRAEKRRLSLAAKQLGQELTWRRAGEGVLRFVLSEPGGPRPGGRRRGSKAERELEQTVIEAVMTDDVAAVSGTTPNTEAAPEEDPAPQASKGRRRKQA